MSGDWTRRLSAGLVTALLLAGGSCSRPDENGSPTNQTESTPDDQSTERPTGVGEQTVEQPPVEPTTEGESTDAHSRDGGHDHDSTGTPETAIQAIDDYLKDGDVVEITLNRE